MAIIITGTPGTGKTTYAKELAIEKKYVYLDVNKIIEKKKLSEGYDRKRKSKIVDIKKLNKELIKIIKKDKNIVVDSHLSHYLPKKYVNICIVTKCNLKTLEKRLKKRGYSKSKIRENLDAEIFDTCRIEAEELGHKVKVVFTDKAK
jgi:adenylate kinase